MFPAFSRFMECTVLYCTVLYCTVLYCTVLYCTVLYCTVLYCTVGLPGMHQDVTVKVQLARYVRYGSCYGSAHQAYQYLPLLMPMLKAYIAVSIDAIHDSIYFRCYMDPPMYERQQRTGSIRFDSRPTLYPLRSTVAL
jgi:hypothetical protein